jgi:hypothetical protein
MVPLRLYRPVNAAYAAVLIPASVLRLNLPLWISQRASWIAALLVLVIEIVLFVWLQRRELQRLLSTTPAKS